MKESTPSLPESAVDCVSRHLSNLADYARLISTCRIFRTAHGTNENVYAVLWNENEGHYSKMLSRVSQWTPERSTPRIQFLTQIRFADVGLRIVQAWTADTDYLNYYYEVLRIHDLVLNGWESTYRCVRDQFPKDRITWHAKYGNWSFEGAMYTRTSVEFLKEAIDDGVATFDQGLEQAVAESCKDRTKGKGFPTASYVRFFLDNGATPTEDTVEGAACQSEIEALKMLIDAGGVPSAYILRFDVYSVESLDIAWNAYDAANHPSKPDVEDLMTNAIQWRAKNRLHDSNDLTQWFFDHGGRLSDTLLEEAVENGLSDLAKLLVSRGAIVTDNVLVAAMKGTVYDEDLLGLELFEWLVDRGGEIQQRLPRLINFAALQSLEVAVKVLVSKGAVVDDDVVWWAMQGKDNINNRWSHERIVGTLTYLLSPEVGADLSQDMRDQAMKLLEQLKVSKGAAVTDNVTVAAMKEMKTKDGQELFDWMVEHGEEIKHGVTGYGRSSYETAGVAGKAHCMVLCMIL